MDIRGVSGWTFCSKAGNATQRFAAHNCARSVSLRAYAARFLTRIAFSCAASLLVLPGAAGNLAAQTRLDIGPYLGTYVPIGIGFRERRIGDGAQIERKPLATLVIGMRAGVLLADHFGIDASIGYSPSAVAVSSPTGTVDLDGQTVIVNARARVPLMQRNAWRFYVAPGIALIERAGTAWKQTSGTRDVTAVLAGGGSVGLGKRVKVNLDLEDMLTWGRFNDGLQNETRKQLHHNVVWSFAVAIPLINR
jgi:hypothetical protein